MNKSSLTFSNQKNKETNFYKFNIDLDQWCHLDQWVVQVCSQDHNNSHSVVVITISHLLKEIICQWVEDHHKVIEDLLILVAHNQVVLCHNSHPNNKWEVWEDQVNSQEVSKTESHNSKTEVLSNKIKWVAVWVCNKEDNQVWWVWVDQTNSTKIEEDNNKIDNHTIIIEEVNQVNNKWVKKHQNQLQLNKIS